MKCNKALWISNERLSVGSMQDKKKTCKRNAGVVQRNQEVNVGDMRTKSVPLCAINVLSQKKSTVVKMKVTEMSMLKWPY